MESIKIIEFVLKEHILNFELEGTFIETTDDSWCVKRGGHKTDNYVIPKSSIEFVHTYEIKVCDAPKHLTKMSDELKKKLQEGNWG